MNFYKLFYWLTVGDKLSEFFFAFAVLFTILALILVIAGLLGNSSKGTNETLPNATKTIVDKDGKKYEVFDNWYVAIKRYRLTFIFCSLLFWLLYVGTPNKKEAILIIGGGYVMNFVTQDTAIRQLPSDIVYFIRSNLQLAAKEAQVEIRNLTDKKTLSDSLSEMSKEQLTDYIKKRVNN